MLTRLDKDKYGKPKKLTYDQLENIQRFGFVALVGLPTSSKF